MPRRSRTGWLAGLGWLGIFLVLPAWGAGQTELPVYMEESHAGTFYFLASTLPLDEPHTLILVDAHTDASAIAGSDEVRASLRQGPTRAAQARLFEEWRRAGRIQCYNWLEPLMPAPVSEVILVSGAVLPQPQLAMMQVSARSQLDAHEEAVPRDCGGLGERYRAMDLRALEKELAGWPDNRAVLASVDLDYFASLPEAHLKTAMDQVLDPILQLPGLRALTFCISSPWQRTPEQAERLLVLALDAVLRVPRARLRFEPFADCGPDQSLQARSIREAGGSVPVFDIRQSGPTLRSLLAAHWRSGMTLTETGKMEKLAGEFRQDPFLPRAGIPGKLTAPDGDWHLDAAELGELSLEVRPEPIGAAVQWQVLVPASSRSRVMDGPWTYAAGAPRWMRWNLHRAGEGKKLKLEALRPWLEPALGCGTVKVRAEVEREGIPRFSGPVTLRVKAAGTTGFRAALSEQARLPYVFGSTLLQSVAPDGTLRTGVECGEGADCANFLSAAFRSQGWRTRQGSAVDFLGSLKPATRQEGFTAEDVDRGLILDLGPHVAAMWEDRAPQGRLDDGDLCVHQLEGMPEWVTFGELRQGREMGGLFELDRAAGTLPRLVFGGDVMLGRTVGARLAAGKPVTGFDPRWFAGAAAGVVNLECPIPRTGTAGPGFSAPAAAAAFLRSAGVHAVSLANNHAGDAGASGIQDTLKTLEAAGVKGFGQPSDPLILKVPGSVSFQLFGWDEGGGVPAVVLAEKMRAAPHPIVFAHWGPEHSRVPADGARTTAALFIEAGARLIVGAGPHAVQPLEWIQGVPVAWSLGNLIFDGRGPDPEWRRGALLEVTLNPSGGIVRCFLREVPVAGE